jgi:ABC-type molybdate transport system ATPase subunit
MAARGTMEKLAASTKRPGLAKAAKRAVGVYLLKLRENRDKTAFLAVLGLCGIGKNRAYQLMAGARKASNIKGKTAAGTGLS